MNGASLLDAVAETLAQLPWKLVYLGGSTTHLHLTDENAPQPEFTEDVDAVVEITSVVEFQVHLRERLRVIGAKEDTSEGAPLCRWILKGVQIDIMSPNEKVLGFSNRWYPLVLSTAKQHRLKGGVEVSVIHAPVFLATKLEAYGDRGQGDCLSSKDVEDIIALLDGRPQIADELKATPTEMQEYVRRQLSQLRDDPNLVYAVEGYLSDAPNRASTVFERVDSILEFQQHK